VKRCGSPARSSNGEVRRGAPMGSRIVSRGPGEPRER
jgi:hypothetical protein